MELLATAQAKEFSERLTFLRAQALFKGLRSREAESVLEAVALHLKPRTFRRGEVLIRKGAIPATLLFVRSGAIELLGVPTLEPAAEWVNSTSGEWTLACLAEAMDSVMEQAGSIGAAPRWTELPVMPDDADDEAKLEIVKNQMAVLQSWAAQAKAQESREALKELLPLTKPKLMVDNLQKRCGLRPVTDANDKIMWLSKEGRREEGGTLY